MKCNLHHSSIKHLRYLIENAGYLTELDISWNEINEACMVDLTETLMGNRKLQYINLSWNSLKEGNRVIDQEACSTATEKLLSHNLGKLIKHNPRLLHLDLSHCGLSKFMLQELGPTLRRAKSLLSLHLNGNPGIDGELKRELHARVHAMPYFEPVNINLITKNIIGRLH